MNCSIDKIKKKLNNSQNVENTVCFSIIIPVYNTEKYLRRCLDSVVNQTFNDIEIIIVNDFSQGNCKEIIEEYQKKDNRIKYIEHSENKSLLQARKTEISHLWENILCMSIAMTNLILILAKKYLML